jgi:pimeloyl-ACP methyl ester carboxylesterase
MIKRNKWYRYLRLRLKRTMLWSFLKSSTLCLVNVACGGSAESDLQSVESAIGEGVTFVIIGGFASCKGETTFGMRTPWAMPMYANYLTLHQRVFHETGLEPQYLLVCHMWEKNEWRFASSYLDTVYTGDLPDIVSEMVYASSMYPENSLNVVGFSRGGWLAMEALLQLPPEVPVAQLTTIDPIGLGCNIGTFLQNTLTSVVGRGASQEDCLNAPKELSGLDRLAIRNRVNGWDQHYQTRSRLIHSSKISEAHRNFFYDFSDFDPMLPTAHSAMDGLPEVWGKVAAGN